jgi:hypothetical protein
MFGHFASAAAMLMRGVGSRAAPGPRERSTYVLTVMCRSGEMPQGGGRAHGGCQDDAIEMRRHFETVGCFSVM